MSTGGMTHPQAGRAKVGLELRHRSIDHHDVLEDTSEKAKPPRSLEGLACGTEVFLALR
jgi:hypothetical protein